MSLLLATCFGIIHLVHTQNFPKNVHTKWINPFLLHAFISGQHVDDALTNLCKIAKVDDNISKLDIIKTALHLMT